MITANAPRPAADDLAAARIEVELVDHAIVQLLGERLRAASIIGESKRRQGIGLFDPEQEAAVIRRATEWAREAALPVEEIRDLFWRIIAITRRAQVDRA